MLYLNPIVEAGILEIAPGFRAFSIVVESTGVVDPSVAEAAVVNACAAALNGEPSWSESHLLAWEGVFKKFGVKRKSGTCSADALRKRVLKDGQLPRINPVVDLYNAISVKYAVPVGGENLDAYVGPPRLCIADGAEIFDAMKDGQQVEEHPDAGEVIWRDDRGVTCRRWNWRQGVRTRLNSDAKNMWFILESTPEMPIEALHAAGEDLIAGLQNLLGNAKIEKSMIGIKLLL
ncbi:MAG: hypothetical protein IAF58_04355 [Leptolyngbya sp.]|nr:hypothetical protein [Candidatus Melainabacteria bacterium]